jgi:hypothetical protein
MRAVFTPAPSGSRRRSADSCSVMSNIVALKASERARSLATVTKLPSPRDCHEVAVPASVDLGTSLCPTAPSWLLLAL